MIEEKFIPLKEIPKKWEGGTEVLLVLKGKIKEMREIEKTQKKEAILAVKNGETVVIVVGPKTEIFFEDEARGDIHSFENAEFIEAFCNIVPEKGRFIARLIKIIKSRPVINEMKNKNNEN